jgi:hypothetical protein
VTKSSNGYQRIPADQGIPRILPADQGIPGIRSPLFALFTTSGGRYEVFLTKGSSA